MDMHTKWAAEEFLRHIESSPAMERFRAAQNTYNHDPEVTGCGSNF